MESDLTYKITRDHLVELLEKSYKAGWSGYLDAKECEAERIAQEFINNKEDLSRFTITGETCNWSRDGETFYYASSRSV